MNKQNLSQIYNGKTKFIVVTGGVISGLGKGVAAASIGALLSDKLKVVPVKCDGYLNTDPGTMNPTEHGEVYVLDDGGEVDMDFGHYERFLNVVAKKEWSLTMGRIFKTILDKEKQGDYLGHTVQFIPHVTNVIKENLFSIANKEDADILLVEIGGTVGDLENQFYIEAVRQLSHEVGQENCVFVHLTYIPIPPGVNEQKSKPTQMSVRDLNELGIYPDIIIGRCEEFIKPHIKEKIGLFCNLPASNVISGVDVKHVYEVPLVYDKEGIPGILLKKLRIYAPPKLDTWACLVDSLNKNQVHPRKVITVALCGRDLSLEDSYASVIESLNHASAHLDLKVEIRWVDVEKMEKRPNSIEKILKGVNAVIVPGSSGKKGMEGKILLVRYAREKNIPFLGICSGMQLAVVEFARHVCGLTGAHTTESEETHIEHPIIIGSCSTSMRLGGHDVRLKEDSKAVSLYQQELVRERFRHCFDVNLDYKEQLESAGLVFSGHSFEPSTPQLIELKKHPYFLACQFHPELKSSLLNPAPLFLGLLKAADEQS